MPSKVSSSDLKHGQKKSMRNSRMKTCSPSAALPPAVYACGGEVGASVRMCVWDGGVKARGAWY